MPRSGAPQGMKMGAPAMLAGTRAGLNEVGRRWCDEPVGKSATRLSRGTTDCCSPEGKHAQQILQGGTAHPARHEGALAWT